MCPNYSMAETETPRLTYMNVVKKLQKSHPNVCYDSNVCDDPICRTLAKAMIEVSQGGGWLLIWALDIIAKNVPFDKLYDGMCGNAIACIKAALYGWETHDEEDYKNALIVLDKITVTYDDDDDDDDDDYIHPILLRK